MSFSFTWIDGQSFTDVRLMLLQEPEAVRIGPSLLPQKNDHRCSAGPIKS
jgi:hypothetical protein